MTKRKRLESNVSTPPKGTGAYRNHPLRNCVHNPSFHTCYTGYKSHLVLAFEDCVEVSKTNDVESPSPPKDRLVLAHRRYYVTEGNRNAGSLYKKVSKTLIELKEEVTTDNAVYHEALVELTKRHKPIRDTCNVTKIESDSIQPTDIDILCGRGSTIASHPGNIYYHKIMQSNLQKYLDGPRRIDRTIIVTSLVHQLLQGGSRFLKKDKTTNQWVELDSLQYHEKVGHALRDLVRKAKRSSYKKARKTLTELKEEVTADITPSSMKLSSSCWNDTSWRARAIKSMDTRIGSRDKGKRSLCVCVFTLSINRLCFNFHYNFYCNILFSPAHNDWLKFVFI